MWGNTAQSSPLFFVHTLNLYRIYIFFCFVLVFVVVAAIVVVVAVVVKGVRETM